MTHKLDMRALLAQNIDKIEITAREKKIIEYRHGLTYLHTLEETGKKFGVTRERIRQIEEKIKNKLLALTQPQ